VDEYQPYYRAYLLHTGADPGNVTGYILWISSKWREWKEMNGLDRWWRPNEKQREQFEQWLFEAVGDAVLRGGERDESC
jgi:hypothetical protein